MPLNYTDISFNYFQGFDVVTQNKFIIDFNEVFATFRSTVYPLYDDHLINSYGFFNVNENAINLKRYVKNMDLPEMIINAEETQKQGVIKQKNPSDFDIEDFVIEFYPTSDMLAKKFYYNWNIRKVNPNTGVNRCPVYYEADIVFYIFDRTTDISSNNTELFTQYKEKKTLHRCFPVMLDKTQFDYNSKDMLNSYAITFTCNGGMDVDFNE